MASYTRYLVAKSEGVNQVGIQVTDSSPVDLAQSAIHNSHEIRYSPIMAAYLKPNEPAPPIPGKINSVALVYSNIPYTHLGAIRLGLKPQELASTYFTEGLASIVFLNFENTRVKELCDSMDNCPFEYWPLKQGTLDIRNIVVEIQESKRVDNNVVLPTAEDPELKVYVEQIASSLASLWKSYSIYFPDEIDTLKQIVIASKNLIQQHDDSKKNSHNQTELMLQKKSNAIVSGLVEISAALSYAVTQGTSGSLPALSNRSPFPHHSLLGIGGAIRALTKYTRYIESAFVSRSAAAVIREQYSTLKCKVPASIPNYNSALEHKFEATTNDELFDRGGDFHQKDHVPLITHFSLRHGFMESKYGVTAASEALTAETLPQWTLMTLSHEVMHSRVRAIFQAFFGKKWSEHEFSLISTEDFDSFNTWISTRAKPDFIEAEAGVRNAILNFCYAMERCNNPVSEREYVPGKTPLSIDKLTEYYTRYKQLASEIIVHFHDFYFIYALQSKMYVMSLWVSWIKVAAPYARPLEYLTRSLAALACGSGLDQDQAFNQSKDILLEGLDALETTTGVRSPLFKELRRLLTDEESLVRGHFYPCYYLIDVIRQFFASRKIAAQIDRLECDPFSEGSTFASDYEVNIYAYGDGKPVSPIRYSLAMLYKTLSNQIPIEDAQWLTARNYMVISSQETRPC